MNNPPRPIAFIFVDYDGVLVDSLPTMHKVYQRICARLDKECPTDLKEFGRAMNRSSRGFMVDRNYTAEETQQHDEMFLKEIVLEQPPIFPGVKEALQTLSKEYVLVLLTASNRVEVEQKLARYGIKEFFQEVCASDHLGPLKKTPAMLAIMERRGVTPSQVLSIGDRTIDFKASRDAGIPTENIIIVEYGWGHESHGDLAHEAIHSPEMLVRHIESHFVSANPPR